MRSFAAILTLILFSFPAYAQLVVPYYSLSCDSDFPSEQHVIDRVFTGNTPAFRVYFYTSNGTPANLSGTWAMTFAYGYTQQDTNGMVRIPGTWTNSNTCLFTSTNAFAGARDWYFSVYGNNTISGVKTFARGKMIEEYDPATGNSANLNLRTTFNWDEISNTGTPPWSLPGLWTTNLSGDVILPSGVLNLTNVTTMVAEPTTNTHAASKGYVDTADADLYPRNNPSNYVQSSITNGLATASWVTANFLTEAIAETLFDALGATATYSNWAEAYFYPRNNPSNYVTASVTNGLWAYVDGTNWVWITFYPRNNPSNWVTASITNGLYPASNPSNWVTASVTTGLYQASNPSNWVQASITNGLWVYQDGTNWVWLSFYPRNNPSNWVTAAITANVPTRAEASNSVTYETLAANGDIGVGAAQVAQGSHGHNSYLWSIGWSNSTSNYAAESSTVATVYFKTNWATENPDLIYPRNNPSNWITAITATSIVAGVGSTNVGMGLTNIYVQSNGVWILMPAVGGGGGGDVYLANNNVFTGPIQTMPTAVVNRVSGGTGMSKIDPGAVLSMESSSGGWITLSGGDGMDVVEALRLYGTVSYHYLSSVFSVDVQTTNVNGGANMAMISPTSQLSLYASDDGFAGGDIIIYGRGRDYATGPSFRVAHGDPGKTWVYGDLDVAGNLVVDGTLNGLAVSALATNAGPAGGQMYAMSNNQWTAFTPGSGSAVTAHAPSHAGAGSDPITGLGAVTYSGTQDYGANTSTNVGRMWVGNSNYKHELGNNYTLYGCTNSVTSINSINLYRSSGTLESPGVTSNGYSMAVNYRVWNGSAWKQAAVLLPYSTEEATASYNGAAWRVYITKTNQTAITEVARWNQDGLFGLNDTTPSYHLDVNGHAQVQSNLYVSDDIVLSGGSLSGVGTLTATNVSVMSSIVSSGTSNGCVNTLATGTSSDSTTFYITSLNRTATLALEGTNGVGSFFRFRVNGDSTGTNVARVGCTDTNGILIQTGPSNSERMRITSAGLVGINDTTPSYHLDVNGHAQVQSNLYVLGEVYGTATNSELLTGYAVTGTNATSALKLSANTTHTIAAGSSTAVQQAALDQYPLNLNGKTLTFLWSAGTYTNTAPLKVPPYYNGTLQLQGPAGTTSIHSNQTAILYRAAAGTILNIDSQGTAGVNVYDLKISGTTASGGPFLVYVYWNARVYMSGNWITGSSTADGYGAIAYGGSPGQMNVVNTYFSNIANAIASHQGANVYVIANGKTGTSPSVGHYSIGGLIFRGDANTVGTTDNSGKAILLSSGAWY